MASARLHDMIPGPATLPAPAPGATWLIYEARGTAEELDGAIRVVPPLLAALGPANVSVEGAERLARIAAAVARALAPGSPGGRSMTLAEIAEVAGVALDD